MKKSSSKLNMAALTQLRLAYAQEQPDWARLRLRIMHMVAHGHMTIAKIAETTGVSTATVCNYTRTFRTEGLTGLLKRKYPEGKMLEIIEPPRTKEIKVGQNSPDDFKVASCEGCYPTNTIQNKHSGGRGSTVPTLPLESATLYAALLELKPPWRVVALEMNSVMERLEITTEHEHPLPVLCTKCGRECIPSESWERRHWRHLDTMQFETMIRCRTQIYHCAVHGAISIPVPWAEAHRSFTKAFEAHAYRALKESRNMAAARRLVAKSLNRTSRFYSLIDKQKINGVAPTRKVIPDITSR